MRKSVVVAVVSVISLSACQSAKSDRDTSVAVPQGVGAVTESPGGLAARREPQAYLDSARQWLTSKENAEAVRVLGLAAPLLREHADMPTSAAKNELRASASELDSIVALINAGKVVTVDEYLPMLVRINLSEAEHHRSQAAVAWVNHDTVVTGEELIMSADHFDRALRDKYSSPVATLSTLVNESLAIGAVMQQRQAFKERDVNTALRALGRSILDERGNSATIRK